MAQVVRLVKCLTGAYPSDKSREHINRRLDLKNTEDMNIKTFVEGAVDALEGVLARIATMGTEIEKGQTAYIAVGDGDLRVSIPNTHLGIILGLLADKFSAIEETITEVLSAAEVLDTPRL